MSTYLKISGGFDFTPYIKNYECNDDQDIIKKEKQASSGYDSITFADNLLTVINVDFVEGMTDANISSCLSALNTAGNKILFEYWSKAKNKARKAYFFVERKGIKLKPGMINDKWSMTLTQADVASDVDETIVSAYPTAFSDKGNWATETNAYADDGNYATSAGVKNETQVIYYSDFDFAIPEGAIINYVDVEMEYKVSTADSYVRAYIGSAYKNTAVTETSSEAEPLTDEVLSLRYKGTKWTVAKLNSVYSQIKVGFKRLSSTACTMSVNYVKMTVSYTEVG